MSPNAGACKSTAALEQDHPDRRGCKVWLAHRSGRSLLVCADGERCAQGRRALLAEDNLINQRVAQKMLTNLGLVCEVACNGQEAVMLAEKGARDGKPFDVVLMDMAMPVMGGVEASRVGSRGDPDPADSQLCSEAYGKRTVSLFKGVPAREQLMLQDRPGQEGSC